MIQAFVKALHHEDIFRSVDIKIPLTFSPQAIYIDRTPAIHRRS
jgi:hypothetical protein